MAPQSSKSSVAQELVLALSKPKSKPINKVNKKELEKETNRKSSTNPGAGVMNKDKNDLKSHQRTKNADWLTFLSLKNKQNEKTVKDTPPNKSDMEITNDQKDEVLQTLMNQVSVLEKTFGGKVTNLELELRKEKSNRKIELENLKLQLKSSEKLNTELQKNIDQLAKELSNEKNANKSLCHRNEKVIEELNLQNKKLLEKDLVIDELERKVLSLSSWKDEAKAKIKACADFYRVNHSEQLQLISEANCKTEESLRTKLRTVSKEVSLIIEKNEQDTGNLKNELARVSDELEDSGRSVKFFTPRDETQESEENSRPANKSQERGEDDNERKRKANVPLEFGLSNKRPKTIDESEVEKMLIETGDTLETLDDDFHPNEESEPSIQSRSRGRADSETSESQSTVETVLNESILQFSDSDTSVKDMRIQTSSSPDNEVSVDLLYGDLEDVSVKGPTVDQVQFSSISSEMPVLESKVNLCLDESADPDELVMDLDESMEDCHAQAKEGSYEDAKNVSRVILNDLLKLV